MNSRPESGSTFWFTFIAHVGESTTDDPSHESSQDNSIARLRLLVAEDIEVNQIIIRRMLDDAGHQIDVVPDGAAAMRAAQERSYDLVLMDMQMPILDGIEATERIRRLPPPLRDLSVIAITANAMPGDRERNLATGMNGYVRKPIIADALLEEFRTVAAQSKLFSVSDDSLAS